MTPLAHRAVPTLTGCPALHARAHHGAPLPPIEQYRLSWDAASERLLDAAALPLGTPRTRDSISSSLCYYTHYAMGVQPVFDVFYMHADCMLIAC
jgi:hypothetical protein